MLVDGACRSVEREGRGYRVGGSVPGSVEADAGEGAACGDAAVVTFVLYRDVGAALGFNAVPELRNCLSVGEGPGKLPICPGDRSRIFDVEGCSKLAGVLR